MAAIEVSAQDIESAIAQGLTQLNLIRAEVKIEVLDEGSRGVLGIGAKPARVRLTPFADLDAARSQSATRPTPKTAPVAAQRAGNKLDADDGDGDDDDGVDDDGDDVDVAADETSADVVPTDTAEADEAPAMEIEGAESAANLAQGVLERMGFVAATCTCHSVLPQDENDHPMVWVDIDFEPNDDGDEEADTLLAHGQEALAALQTIVQTMWSHQTKSSVRITLDVNGYKARKQSQVQQMAKRMAERVVATGRSITLEPMPGSERRLVHMALRDHPQVFTESQGEGNGRKVTIKLKK